TDGIVDSTTGAVRDTLPLCSATQHGLLQTFFFGDLRSRCGRHNGFVDTEDLDGDFRLDSVAGVRTVEGFVRFVFPIGDERFYVRDGAMLPAFTNGLPDGTSGWRLDRIPCRTETLQGGRADLPQVQRPRGTVVGLQTGQRAEAFLRFTAEGDKNFLKYRRLRTWMRGRGPGWEDGDLHAYIKAGKDQDNFYLYHAPARTISWDPEMVVDLDRWLL